MDELKTRLGVDIPITTRGILYLCHYYIVGLPKLEVVREILFDDAFEALNAYANIHNPESQLVTGHNFDELIKNLVKLHNNMDDKEWVKELGKYL